MGLEYTMAADTAENRCEGDLSCLTSAGVYVVVKKDKEDRPNHCEFNGLHYGTDEQGCRYDILKPGDIIGKTINPPMTLIRAVPKGESSLRSEILKGAHVNDQISYAELSAEKKEGLCTQCRRLTRQYCEDLLLNKSSFSV